MTIDADGSRRIELEIDVAKDRKEKVVFWVRSQSFEDVILVKQFIEKYNLIDMKDGMFEAACYSMALRITGWEGVAIKNGENAPCTMEYKSAFFGLYPQSLGALLVSYGKAEEDESKNSQTLQVG